MKTDTNYSTTVISRWMRVLGTMLILALMVPAVALSQATVVNLGAAAGYGALASAGIVGTGTVYGDVGTVTSTVAGTITVAGPGVNRGTVIGQAHTDLSTAYEDARTRTGAVTIAADLIGQTLTGGGVYNCAGGAFSNTGTLTLNGDANSVYIFQMTSYFTTAASSHVVLGTGVLWSKVFWQVGNYATLGANSTFAGTILANAYITVGANTPVQGRLLAGAVASDAQVSLDANTLGTALDPLPVELVSFTATANRMNAELRWSTATEVNNYGFDVERRLVNSQSSTLNSWVKIGFVKGSGTSNSAHSYSYTDASVSSGTFAYRLKQIDNNGTYKYSSEAEVTVSVPKVFALNQNYPNPFNPTTTLQFTLGNDGMTTLQVYNILGQKVMTLFNGNAQAGQVYQVSFDASKLPSGLYIAKLESGQQHMMQKMMLMK